MPDTAGSSVGMRVRMPLAGVCAALIALAPAGAPAAWAQGDVDAFLAGTTSDCPGCDLSGARLKRRDLSNANLAGADLSEAVLHLA